MYEQSQVVFFFIGLLIFLLILGLIIWAIVAGTNCGCTGGTGGTGCGSSDKSSDKSSNKSSDKKDEFIDDSDCSDDEDDGPPGAGINLDMSKGEIEEYRLLSHKAETKTELVKNKDIKDVGEASVEDIKVPLSSVIYHMLDAISPNEIDAPKKFKVNSKDEIGQLKSELASVESVEMVKDIIKNIVGAETPVRRVVKRATIEQNENLTNIASDFSSSTIKTTE